VGEGGKPVKGLIAAVALAIASVVALQGGNDQPARGEDSQLEQGMARVDQALEKGLGEGTHQAIARNADASAEWLRGFGEKVSGAAQ
jgi:hypothetical protein